MDIIVEERVDFFFIFFGIFRNFSEALFDPVLQGSVGERIYVLASGKVQILQSNRVIHTLRLVSKVTLATSKPTVLSSVLLIIGSHFSFSRKLGQGTSNA